MQLNPTYSIHREKLFRTPYESEQIIIGEILWNAELLIKAKKILNPLDFKYEKHQIIFQSMLDMENQGVPIDVLTLWNYLNEKGELENVGGSPYLTYLCEIVISETIKTDSEETDKVLSIFFKGRN